MMHVLKVLLAAIALFGVALLGREAKAQGLTVDDLTSLRVTTSTSYTGTFENALGRAPGKFTVIANITFGADGEFKWTTQRNVIVETPRGQKTGTLNRSGQGKIGVPAKMTDGSGENVWIIDGSSVVRMRTMASGGDLQTIRFTSSPTRWTCKSETPIMTEVGSDKNAKDTSAMSGGGKVEILNVRQTGSSCRVTKG